MDRNVYWLLFCCAFHTVSYAHTYAVYLTDKKQSSFSVQQPQYFLSDASIARRTWQHIPVTETDLPVSSVYLQTILSFNVQLSYPSKWLNCAVIEGEETEVNKLKQLPFVSKILRVDEPKPIFYKQNDKLETVSDKAFSNFNADEYYGGSAVQNTMIHVDFLHKRGFKGDSVLLAHFDAGCFNANNIRGFDSLFKTSRYRGSKDVVDNETNEFDNDMHGTSTLSCISANEAGKLIGTGPNVSVVLFRTEDEKSETIKEEYNWVYAAELADSMGAEVFSTSLGYTTFDGDTNSHKYSDLTGNKAPMTVAGNVAARAGIIVLNSAGNEGAKAWHYIGVPADGDSILAVGAVNGDRIITSFSSRGPNAKGRVKPDVCAQGGNTSVYNTSGVVNTSNGTSFSCPVMAGAAACLRQAFRNATNLEIMDAIRQSANLFQHPDSSYGYGIPDFAVAYTLLKEKYPTAGDGDFSISVFPNPFLNELVIYLKNTNEQSLALELYDFSGKFITGTTITIDNYFDQYETMDFKNIPQGVYLLKVKGKTYYDVKRVVKK